jgi:hypothetical protein
MPISFWGVTLVFGRWLRPGVSASERTEGHLPHVSGSWAAPAAGVPHPPPPEKGPVLEPAAARLAGASLRHDSPWPGRPVLWRYRHLGRAALIPPAGRGAFRVNGAALANKVYEV